MPQPADAVRCAVEAVATANAAKANDIVRHLSLRIDEGVASLRQHTNAGSREDVATSATG